MARSSPRSPSASPPACRRAPGTGSSRRWRRAPRRGRPRVLSRRWPDGSCMVDLLSVPEALAIDVPGSILDRVESYVGMSKERQYFLTSPCCPILSRLSGEARERDSEFKPGVRKRGGGRVDARGEGGARSAGAVSCSGSGRRAFFHSGHPDDPAARRVAYSSGGRRAGNRWPAGRCLTGEALLTSGRLTAGVSSVDQKEEVAMRHRSMDNPVPRNLGHGASRRMAVDVILEHLQRPRPTPTCGRSRRCWAAGSGLQDQPWRRPRRPGAEGASTMELIRRFEARQKAH